MIMDKPLNWLRRITCLVSKILQFNPSRCLCLGAHEGANVCTNNQQQKGTPSKNFGCHRWHFKQPLHF